MNSYAEIQAQIAELQVKAKEARAAEITGAKAEIAAIMRTYDLSIDDLRDISKTKTAKPRQSVPPKYRNPESGETWTGRGRAPLWLAGRDKNEFLIA